MLPLSSQTICIFIGWPLDGESERPMTSSSDRLRHLKADRRRQMVIKYASMKRLPVLRYGNVVVCTATINTELSPTDTDSHRKTPTDADNENYPLSESSSVLVISKRVSRFDSTGTVLVCLMSVLLLHDHCSGWKKWSSDTSGS